MDRAALTALARETGCCEEHRGTVFLCDPHWGQSERAELERLQRYGEVQSGTPGGELGWLNLPTGGTSGGVRFARHDERTLAAAVQGFGAFFGLQRVNAVDVLPAYHVSGFMARVRCAMTGGRHVACDWRRVEAGERPELNHAAGDWVISLVPTQLQRLVTSPFATAWLKQFRIILVGGGPIWPQLSADATAVELPLALTYGMTETAAMVTAITPAEFLKGERTWATPLPHANLTITDTGVVCIGGESVFRGYYPERRNLRVFETSDLGRLDDRGRLQILGRQDAVIITGGKKVQPAEVEAALQATGQFADVAVIGAPHVEWGEEVVACFPKSESTVPDFAVVEHGLEISLASYKRPKRYVAIADWPRNAQGKLSRRELRRRVVAALQ